MPPSSVTIQTGARLHFGPLSHRPEKGRHFGGIGMMISEPGVALTVRKSASGRMSVPEEIAPVLERLQANRPEWDQSIDVDLTAMIPAHQGLGSGTQLGMALSEAVGLLHGEEDLSAKSLARYSRRGQRSSVGLHGYLQGGYLIDAGHQKGETIGQIACRFDFPQAWRIVLVTPPASDGIHGASEAATFAKLSSMSSERTGELCRLTLTEILPSLKHQDFPVFARAIRQYGEIVGEFFTKIQGGKFAHPQIANLADRLLKQGVRSLAQSSWGPTVAIFAATTEDADRISSLVSSDEFGAECAVRIVEPMNHGRILTVAG